MSTVETPVDAHFAPPKDPKRVPVAHKSGDWIYPNGYPNMPHDSDLKPTVDFPDGHEDHEHAHNKKSVFYALLIVNALCALLKMPEVKIEDSQIPDKDPATGEDWTLNVTIPGEPCSRFMIPYNGDPPLTAADEAYLLSIGDTYTMQDRPEAQMDPHAVASLRAIGRPVNADGAATHAEYLESLGGAEGTLKGFSDFYTDKHSVQASATAVSTAEPTATAAQ
ncbi:MAG: hypothetical protein KGL39_17125 [Patescibacteria group bacterium]|nr:hypothetical protein [Patescibacteria group bacterium]